MKILDVKKVKNRKVSTPLFTGSVMLQTPFENIPECDLSLTYVHFLKGVHNKFHKHSKDQILIVTEGQGFVATEKKEYSVKVGDIIWTPAGEIHKHGAMPGKTFTHIAISRSNSKLTQVEK